ncbi:hypothetical protein L1606_08640 [Streptomyces spororaveus]|nr:hypothetical protein [Streptomyces spororaveus]MCM9078133.1 hypothetical protein [Streptomyces spororaveus]
MAPLGHCAEKGGRKVIVHALGVDVDLSEDGPITWEGGGPEVWKRV